MQEECDITFKVLVIGDSGVGKSSILMRYINDVFVEDQMNSTVALELSSKIFLIEGCKIKVQFWDTAGQEKYKAITSSYYKGTKGVLIVYDVTNMESFKSVDKWILDFKSTAEEDSAIMLLGNKCDLIESRKVSPQLGEGKAKSSNVLFIETSAKEDINITKAFTLLVDEIIRKIKQSVCKELNLKENYLTNASQRGEVISICSDKDLPFRNYSRCCLRK